MSHIDIEGRECTQLGDGQMAYVGDIVQCTTNQYTGVALHDTRRVKRIFEGRLTLDNRMSPYGTSDYKPENFKLVHRSSTVERKKEQITMANMLHLAIPIEPGDSPVAFASRVNVSQSDHPHNPLGLRAMPMIAGVSPDDLKNRVRDRIKAHPDERWLLLAGNTIAESDSPPVAFRQW